jgi:hypothetical protein
MLYSYWQRNTPSGYACHPFGKGESIKKPPKKGDNIEVSYKLVFE